MNEENRPETTNAASQAPPPVTVADNTAQQAVSTPPPQIVVSPPVITTPVTGARTSTPINYIEVAGLILGVILLISIFTGMTEIAQVALFIFAGIGMFAVFREVTKQKNTEPLTGTQLSASYTVKAKKPVTATTVLKFATVSILAVILAIFVLPIVGMICLIFLIMIFGGGQSTG